MVIIELSYEEASWTSSLLPFLYSQIIRKFSPYTIRNHIIIRYNAFGITMHLICGGFYNAKNQDVERHNTIMKTFFQELWRYLDRNISANSLTTSFTATSKRDIMFSRKLNMLCSAKEFYNSKSLFYKVFYHFNASQSSLPHRDDGSHRRR